MQVDCPPPIQTPRRTQRVDPPVERDGYDEHDTEWGVQYVVAEVGYVSNACVSAPVPGMRLVNHMPYRPGSEVYGLYTFKESEPLDALVLGGGQLLDRFDSPWRWSVDKPLDTDDGWGNLPYEEWRH